MIVTILSCALLGLEPVLIHVEVDFSNGLPGYHIVGLPDSTVREARERVRAAIKNSGFTFPNRKITINLAPADIKKEGSHFDLAMALGILEASGQLSRKSMESFLVLGELGLNGNVRPIMGALALATIIEKLPYRKLIVPIENQEELSLMPNIQLRLVQSLAQAVTAIEEEQEWITPQFTWAPREENSLDLRHVKGQVQAKRCLEIAAAGNHNLIMVGPPGSGKTMLAQRFSGILPPFELQECMEVSKIQSIAGLFQEGATLASSRPFRAPHCSVSYAGMVGGGSPVRPGELSLAHRGVLFMDELPEFHRDVLEALRQPLEEKKITVVRVSGSVAYPADFVLIAAMNPCPCGFYGDLHRNCVCRPAELLQYRKRISGPLLDRIDLHVEVSRMPHEILSRASIAESSQEIRARVLLARKIQDERFSTKQVTNANLSGDQLEKHCKLSEKTQTLFKEAHEKLHFSARGYAKILRIARTIADLCGSTNIQTKHLAEALQYRVLDRN